MRNKIQDKRFELEKQFPEITDIFLKETDFIPESLFKDLIETLVNENDKEKNQKLKEILSEENIGKASVKRLNLD